MVGILKCVISIRSGHCDYWPRAPKIIGELSKIRKVLKL